MYNQVRSCSLSFSYANNIPLHLPGSLNVQTEGFQLSQTNPAISVHLQPTQTPHVTRVGDKEASP